MIGTFVFALIVVVGVSTANAPVKPALADPAGIAVDTSGRVFVVSGNQVLRVSGGVTSVVVGTGGKGFAGDGGSTLSSELSGPQAVAVAPNGDVYIADTGNDRIRLVRGGRITTVAGNGQAGYSGDGGQATSARLDTPEGVAADSTGNIYIADNANNLIRKVDSSGIISTVAGNSTATNYMDGASATTVAIGGPVGVTTDVAGTFWFTADEAVYRVGSNGHIHRVAGGDSAGDGGDGGLAVSALLRTPQGLSIHGTDLYVADTDNERVRMIDAAGIIRTIAGNGTKGFSGDHGEATSAQLTAPDDIAVDGAGRLFIADTGNNHVRLVTTSGIITTVA